MTGEQTNDRYEVDCPHCRKTFVAPLLAGSAARYRGFKCPHCKLFVPSTHGRLQQLPEPA